jgi:hypothetical protein
MARCPLEPIVRSICIFALSALICSIAFSADVRFVVSADGQEVLDNQTNLVWRRCVEGMTWDGTGCRGKAAKYQFGAAKRHGEELAASQGKPWRVPTAGELKSIVIKQKKKPMTDVQAFPGAPSSLHWAKRPGFDDNLNGWMVDFGTGKSFGGSGATEAVRLVRGN